MYQQHKSFKIKSRAGKIRNIEREHLRLRDNLIKATRDLENGAGGSNNTSEGSSISWEEFSEFFESMLNRTEKLIKNKSQ